MNNKSYSKCRLCKYKGSCAFNHNGDQELCDLNVTHLDLADHDKQIRDEVIDEFATRLEKECEFLPRNFLKSVVYSSHIVAEQMKGEQNE